MTTNKIRNIDFIIVLSTSTSPQIWLKISLKAYFKNMFGLLLSSLRHKIVISTLNFLSFFRGGGGLMSWSTIFSVMLGWSHRLLDIYQYFGELKVSCSMTLHAVVGFEPWASRSVVRRCTTEPQVKESTF